MVIENDYSYICNWILGEYLYVNSNLFHILPYCAIYAIVYNMILYVDGFKKIVRLLSKTGQILKKMKFCDGKELRIGVKNIRHVLFWCLNGS